MADGDRPSLAVQERPERGSREARRLRRQGMVPGILYGGTGLDPVAFKVGAHELRRLLVDGAALFDVKIGSETSVPVILKDRQDHPVRGEPLHVDFLEVRLDEKIHAVVSVELHGSEEAPGIVEGGVLEHVTRELNIEALPTAIPEQIDVDVSQLEINATLSLRDLTSQAGVEFLDDLDETTIATVVPPTKVEEPELEQETELIGEDGEPLAGGEEPAEGDAGGDGDGESSSSDE